MILAVGLMLGVVKVRTQMTPKGSEVHSSQGRNLPMRVLVRSAITPMTGLRQATPRPTTRKRFPPVRRKTEGVGVEIQLQGQQGLEDKVGGHVAQGVAGLLSEGELLNHCCLFFRRRSRPRLIRGPSCPIAFRFVHLRRSSEASRFAQKAYSHQTDCCPE